MICSPYLIECILTCISLCVFMQMLRSFSRPKRILHLILAGLVLLVIAWLTSRKRYDDHLLLTDIDSVGGQQLPNKVSQFVLSHVITFIYINSCIGLHDIHDITPKQERLDRISVLIN